MSRRKFSDPGLQVALNDIDENKRGRLQRDLKAVLATDEGCRVLLWIVYSLAEIEGGIDLEGDQAIQHNGRRWVGRQILMMANDLAPARLSQAISAEYAERADAERERDALLTKTSSEGKQENDP